MLGLKELREKVELWEEPWKSHGNTLLHDAYMDLSLWSKYSREIIKDVNESIAATEEEMNEETISLSRKEFDALLDYSFSNPTGVIIGKQWKRKSEDKWFLCEYVHAPGDRYHALIKIKSIIILEEIK